jgi:hypothetical protein
MRRESDGYKVVESVVHLPLDEGETEALRESAGGLRGLLDYLESNAKQNGR